MLGPVPLVQPGPNADLDQLLAGPTSSGCSRVHANADTPEDALRARANGAEGIGLCRTEHMFMAEDRLPIVREMILASDDEKRAAALARLLPMQQSDFEGIFEAMAGLPVTIRLLDPPLHEFLPPLEEVTDEPTRARVLHCARRTRCSGPAAAASASKWPEIYEMQIRAIVRAGRPSRSARAVAPRSRSCIRSSPTTRSSCASSS